MAVAAVVIGVVASQFVGDKTLWVILPWVWTSTTGFVAMARYQRVENSRRTNARWKYKDLPHPKWLRLGVFLIIIAGIVRTAYLVGNYFGMYWPGGLS
ncbi:MAG: hypothetical protein LBN10_08715 [Propionibacteriaceae bacterium]|nr:hypothetical protein [Propionibacteriaceae bacterium]